MKSPRAGFSLILLGLLGGLFFWATDPRWGIAKAGTENLIDAANQAHPGTLVGFASCAVVTVIGFWLLARKAV